MILVTFHDYIINYNVSKWDVLLAIYNFSELTSLTNNAKIRSSLKHLLIRYSISLHEVLLNIDWWRLQVIYKIHKLLWYFHVDKWEMNMCWIIKSYESGCLNFFNVLICKIFGMYIFQTWLKFMWQGLPQGYQNLKTLM